MERSSSRARTAFCADPGLVEAETAVQRLELVLVLPLLLGLVLAAEPAALVLRLLLELTLALTLTLRCHGHRVR